MLLKKEGVKYFFPVLFFCSGRVESQRRNCQFFFDPNCSIESVSCECKNLKSGRADDRSERGLFFLGAVKGAVFLFFLVSTSGQKVVTFYRLEGHFGQQGDRYISYVS